MITSLPTSGRSCAIDPSSWREGPAPRGRLEGKIDEESPSRQWMRRQETTPGDDLSLRLESGGVCQYLLRNLLQ